MRAILSLLLSFSFLKASVVVPNDDYYFVEDGNFSYVYSDEYRDLLPAMKEYQKRLVEIYEEEYGFKMDDKLFVGLASLNNQIANGFSTQIPFNMQLFYGAGASYVDYFCFSSWLKTLIIHETAHNFQLNPKENIVSKVGHRVFGNTPVTFLGLFPIFPIPNALESSFLLEGNSVLNESRFGNGGRLFSGYALAEVVALAKANKITPALMYNATLEFPYGEKFYLVGGFFQQFLAKRYGVKKVNQYFKHFATQPLPFFTNRVFKEHFGESFEALLAQFVKSLKEEHKASNSTQGKLIAKSQIFVPFNSDSEEIYTLVGDKKSAPKILRFNKMSRELSYKKGSWRVGEVFKINGHFYTQSSAKTSPTKVEMGLFDESGYIEKAYASKAIQGFTQSNKSVYFDIESSIETPHIFVNGEFYDQSHSSVYVNKEDLYYFKQEGKSRTLYKNRESLYHFKGHYGFVVDVDNKGAIYFIAVSKHGSSLYKFFNGKSSCVSLADDIIDAKLINQNEALVATMEADGYGYYLISLQEKNSLEPHGVTIDSVAIENRPFKEKKGVLTQKEQPYSPLGAMHFSALNPLFYYSEFDGLGVDAYASFSDSLFQNQLYVVGSHNKRRDIAGLVYDNSAFRLAFGGSIYGVDKNRNYDNSDKRDSGYELYATFPWVEQGYWSVSSTIAYSKPYFDIYRKPLTFSLDIANKKQYGLSRYENESNEFSLFVSEDRENRMYGGVYSFKHDLFWQLYLGAKATYLSSDEVDFFIEKGVELDNTFSNLQADKATLDIPSFTYKTYAKEVRMGELSLAKVFDGSLYLYSLPLSLQRESFYAKQRRYEIDFTSRVKRSYNETTLGATFDFLFFHKLVLPMSLEWIYNKDVLNKRQVRLLIGGTF